MTPISSALLLGRYVNRVRKRLGLTLSDLSMLSQISIPVLSKIERGLVRGDVDIDVSLFRLLPQLGIAVYLRLDERVIKVISRQDLARVIIEARRHQGLKQTELAGLLNISIPTMNKIERAAKDGESRDVRLKLVLKVLEGLGIELLLDSGEAAC